MIPLTVKELVDSVGGALLKGSAQTEVQGISVDSRSILTGELFIPLKGKADGHLFIPDALKAGAAGFVLEKNAAQKELLVALADAQFAIEVEDPLKALQNIAAYYRTKLSAKVIGVTGSTGKTTTKDMLNCVLSHKMRVISTDKNYNNEIGVPLTILRANETTEAMVVEMGMRGVGQIKELAEIARPDIGVVTNIGQAHMELLGSEELIAQAKAELVEAIPEHGVAVLNADDMWTDNIAKCACSKIITYGILDGDVRGSKIEADEFGKARFSLSVENGSSYTVRLPIPGKHNVYNALAASAVAHSMGLTPDDVRIGLQNCRLSAMRMEMFNLDDNVLVINDAYNANPTSVQAALGTLMDIKAEGRHISVLGDMLELGSYTNEAHKQVGEVVASLGVDVLVAVGAESQVMADSAIKAGMSHKAVITCPDSNTAAQLLKQLIEPGDVILVKASRGIGLEVVVRALAKI